MKGSCGRLGSGDGDVGGAGGGGECWGCGSGRVGHALHSIQ